MHFDTARQGPATRVVRPITSASLLLCDQRTLTGRIARRLLATVAATLTAGCGGGTSDVTKPTTPPPVSPVASTLTFTRQPSRTLSGRLFKPAVTVQVLDAQGNTFASGSARVSLVMRSATGAAAALSGTTSQVTVGGVATFTDLVAAADGENMELVASAPGLSSANSTKFKVDPLPTGIDSTVLRLVSDSAALRDGLYVFQASGTISVNLDSGRVIVGAERGGFLRRIIRSERTGSIVRLQTVSASLDEVIQNDSLVVHLTLAPAASSRASQRGLVATKPPTFRPASAAIVGADGEYTINNVVLIQDPLSGKALLKVARKYSLAATSANREDATASLTHGTTTDSPHSD